MSLLVSTCGRVTLIISGFGGIFGVGQAAVHPPSMVVLGAKSQHTKKTVVMVGKGIEYDAGGLSIKSKEGMPGVKADMGGAAAVLHAFDTAVRADLVTSGDFSLYAILCLAENSVGPCATRPDDIHTMFSGKTVEINNTDAEGRLVSGIIHTQWRWLTGAHLGSSGRGGLCYPSARSRCGPRHGNAHRCPGHRHRSAARSYCI